MDDDFVELARRYCEFIDSSTSLSRREVLAELERHFVDLYSAALRLSQGVPADDDDDFAHPEWRVIFERLTEQLGDASAYWMVFDPFATERPVLGDLADDAADIYSDLLRGLAMIDAGRPRDEAIWEWRSAFEMHWGRHAAEGLYALRVLQDGSGSKWA